MRKKWPDEKGRRLYKDLQRRLAEKVIIEGPDRLPETLLAIDVSYRKGHAYVGAVKWSIKKACPLRIYLLKVPMKYPYISGMFFIRELPPIVSIVKNFSIEFDLLLLNAAGIAHPDRIGLASHAGLYFKKPSMGITERIPQGTYKMPNFKKGSYNPIFDENKNVIGFVMRSQDYVKPVFITPGHLISPDNAFKIALNLPYYSRFPEPLRIADIYSRKEFEKEVKEGCS